MKFSFALVSLLVVFTLTKAETASSPSLEEGYKKLTDILGQFSKKFSEITDKDKLLDFLKTTSSKLKEEFQALSEKLQKDSKIVPEDLKQKYNDLVKQINEAAKGLSTEEVQTNVQKLQEVIHASVKKIAEQSGELSKSLGVNVPESVQKNVFEIYDDIAKTVQSVLEKTQSAVKESRKAVPI